MQRIGILMTEFSPAPREDRFLVLFRELIDQFRFIKIRVKTIDLSTRLWEINTEFVGFIPQPRAEVYCFSLNFNISKFRYIKIQPKTIDLNTRLWGINGEFVGFIPQSLVLRSIVLG